MKKILIAAALIVSGLLSGCNQLTQYTVSEQEINQALQKRNHFAKDIGLKGVADAHIELQNLTSAIGREEPGKVTLSGIANVDLNSLFGTQKATIDLKLKALPTFDRKKAPSSCRKWKWSMPKWRRRSCSRLFRPCSPT